MKSTLQIIVQLPGGGQTEFSLAAHLSIKKDDRLIEPAFYKDEPPEGPHHEIEIESPRIWEHEHGAHIHFHRVPGTDRNFVCWTGALRLLRHVEPVVRMWCLGTAYTMQTGLDFLPEYARDPDTFIERMRDEHNLKITVLEITPFGF